MLWTGFDCVAPVRLEAIMADVDGEIRNMERLFKRSSESHGAGYIPYRNVYDDVCLLKFLKGLLLRELAVPCNKTMISVKEFIQLKPSAEQRKVLMGGACQLLGIIKDADKIMVDHFLLPFCRFELGKLYLVTGDYANARSELKAAGRGGVLETESVSPKKGFSNEMILQIKLHNCAEKLVVLQRLSLLAGKR